MYGPYILDFYCHPLLLAIEVDGPIHQREEVKATDAVRQQQLETSGLFFLRFTNEEVLTRLNEVQEKIELMILQRCRGEEKLSTT